MTYCGKLTGRSNMLNFHQAGIERKINHHNLRQYEL